MSNVQSKKMTPQIRYKNFSEEWSKKIYTETFDTSVSNNTLSRAELTTERTSTQNVHYGDVLIKFDSILDVKKNKIPYIPEDVKIDTKNLLKNGDIVFADTAEDETCGKAIELNNIENEKLVAGLHTFVARPKVIFEPKYLGYFINSPSYHNQLLPFMQGTKVTSISKTSIQKTWINYPSSNEQSKISSLFSQIDFLIASVQKEYDKLLVLRKCMLKKMFPKKGSLVPEIRFKGFIEDWEEKKLNEGVITDFIVPMRDKPKQFGGTIPWTRIEDIQGKYLNGTTSNQYVSEETVKSMNLKIIPKDSLIVSSSASFGIVAIVTQDLITNQTFIGLVPSPEYDLNFLYILFCSDDVLEKMKQKSAGSTIFYIAREEFERLSSLFPPSYEEQMKIGLYFQNLDNLISKQAAELEKLKNVKKTLLSKMFV